jgi:hypothetical protein
VIGVFPAGVRVLWREPFHDTLVPATAVGPGWMSAHTAIRLDSGTVVAARRDRLIRR